MRTKRCAIILVLLCAAPAPAETITVSAAASLKEAMGVTCRAFEAKTGNHVELNFAASGPLELQIEQGAPVDVFVSAADEQVKRLIRRKLVLPSSRHVIARNQLVLVAPAAEKNPPTSFDDLLNTRIHKISIGQPDTVPAGMYARQTLRAMKLFNKLLPKLVYGASVRQVLAYVIRDEVDAAMIYTTDAIQGGSAVKILATAKPVTHEPIEYPAVILKSSAHQNVDRELIGYWLSSSGQRAMAKLGFEPVAATTATPPGK